MGCAALVLASCTDDALENGGSSQTPDTPEMDANMITLTALDPASQAGRIHMVPQTRGVKSERLNFVASIDNPEVSGEDKNWSVTSLLIENNACFVTWHSDYQADGSPAKVWGGALDILNLNDNSIDPGHTFITEEVKFNNIMHDGEYFYMSGGHYNKGAVVVRIKSGNLAELSENTYASCIGFPGTSVNAIAKDAEGLVAVSGFRGGYGYFDGSWATRIVEDGVAEDGTSLNKEVDDYDFYNYDDPTANTWITSEVGNDKDFGGKYVALDEGSKAYILRSLGAAGLEILDPKSGDAVVESPATLLSETKKAEEYDPEKGDWVALNPADHPEYLGKHVMVIKDSQYAYVGAGQSGLRVFDLMTGNEISWADQTNAPEGETNYGPNTTGLCIDGNFLYAATDMGLRIYKFLEGGKLELYAFEVESYGEDGKPTTNDAAKTDTETRHSCNFVAVQTQGDAKYVYVAYGQSGIRVYKFEPNAEASDGE